MKCWTRASETKHRRASPDISWRLGGKEQRISSYGILMKKEIVLWGCNSYPAPAQPAAVRQGGPRLGLPKRFRREQPKSVKVIWCSTRFASSGTLGQMRAAGVAKATSRPECRRQRSMPAQGLGCQMLLRELTVLSNKNHNPKCFGSGGTPGPRPGIPKRFHREQLRQVEGRRFSTRFGSGGTPAGAAGRTAFMKYAG